MKSTFCWDNQLKMASIGSEYATMERPLFPYLPFYFAADWAIRVIAPVLSVFISFCLYWVQVVPTVHGVPDNRRQYLLTSL